MSDLDDLEELLGFDRGPPKKRRFRMKGDTDTHCKRGHELTPDNVWLGRNQNGSEIRTCKKCSRLRDLCRED